MVDDFIITLAAKIATILQLCARVCWSHLLLISIRNTSYTIFFSNVNHGIVPLWSVVEVLLHNLTKIFFFVFFEYACSGTVPSNSRNEVSFCIL
jgi:hypothetical protein